jgi:hypothetical protein
MFNFKSREFKNLLSVDLDFGDNENVSDASFMFLNCESFNQNVDSWIPHMFAKSDEVMYAMFYNTAMSNDNLLAWKNHITNDDKHVDDTVKILNCLEYRADLPHNYLNFNLDEHVTTGYELVEMKYINVKDWLAESIDNVCLHINTTFYLVKREVIFNAPIFYECGEANGYDGSDNYFSGEDNELIRLAAFGAMGGVVLRSEIALKLYSSVQCFTFIPIEYTVQSLISKEYTEDLDMSSMNTSHCNSYSDMLYIPLVGNLNWITSSEGGGGFKEKKRKKEKHATKKNGYKNKKKQTKSKKAKKKK